MSDQSMNSSAPAPFNAGPQTVLPPAPKPRNAGTAILIGAAGLVVLAAIIGIVAYVLMSAGTSQVPAAGPVVPGTGSPSTPATSTATGTVSPIPTTDNGDVFTPRNPFEVIAPVKIASTNDNNNDSGSNNDTSTALTLTDIKTVNGEDVAVVKLGGTSYTVGEGDTVGDSDWQVVQINNANVVFLYGDQRITISLGQGTSSK